MRILVVSLAGIGDTLFATPLIHELRLNFPQATVDAVVLWRGSGDLLRGNPHLNSVFQKNLISAGFAESFKFFLELRRRKYDISLNTHPQSRVHYRAVARLVGARARVSHVYDCSGSLDSLLVNHTVAQNYGIHAVENNLELLSLIGAKRLLPSHSYEIFLTPSETDWADAFIKSHQLGGRPRLGVHVGSGGTKNLALRRWPLENFLALFKQLAQTHPNLGVLLFGGPEEEKSHATILSQAIPQQVIVAKTGDLRQAAALLRTCDAFLSVDTALMHLAAAMRVRHQFVIETPTWNTPIQPYGNDFVVIPNPAVAGRNLEYYRYDGKGIKGTPEELARCMAAVSVDAVHRAVSGAFK